jgi:hypothetical protein
MSDDHSSDLVMGCVIDLARHIDHVVDKVNGSNEEPIKALSSDEKNIE